MKKLILVLMIAIAFSFIFCNITEAERLAPKKVELVVYNDIKYTSDKMNYVEAWDAQTGKKFWELKVYDVIYDQVHNVTGRDGQVYRRLKSEKDFQEVWINSLRIEDGKLIVTNERNEEYEVNLETKEINKR